jgi:hypothetical protein
VRYVLFEFVVFFCDFFPLFFSGVGVGLVFVRRCGWRVNSVCVDWISLRRKGSTVYSVLRIIHTLGVRGQCLSRDARCTHETPLWPKPGRFWHSLFKLGRGLRFVDWVGWRNSFVMCVPLVLCFFGWSQSLLGFHHAYFIRARNGGRCGRIPIYPVPCTLLKLHNVVCIVHIGHSNLAIYEWSLLF